MKKHSACATPLILSCAANDRAMETFLGTIDLCELPATGVNSQQAPLADVELCDCVGNRPLLVTTLEFPESLEFFSVQFGAQPAALVYALANIFLGASAMLSSINFIVTIRRGRAPGMSINRLPILNWGADGVSRERVGHRGLLFVLPSACKGEERAAAQDIRGACAAASCHFTLGKNGQNAGPLPPFAG